MKTTSTRSNYGVAYSKKFIDPRERNSVSEVRADDEAVIFPNGRVYEVVNLEKKKNCTYPKDSKDIIVAKDTEGRRMLLVPNGFNPIYCVAHNNVVYAVGGLLGLATIVGGGIFLGNRAIRKNPENANKIANIAKFWMITIAGGFAGFWGSIPYADTGKRIERLREKLDRSNQIEIDAIKDLFDHNASDVCSINSLGRKVSGD